MDGELTHDTIDNVLETLQAYCACRDNCKGCRYCTAVNEYDALACALRSIPAVWRVDKIGGGENE